MMQDENQICTDCGNLGPPVFINRGNVVNEIMLWLCFILPGLIYSIWRRMGKVNVCASCAQPSVVPLNSQRAQTALKLIKPPDMPLKEFLLESKQGKKRKKSRKPMNDKTDNKQQPAEKPAKEKKQLDSILRNTQRKGLSSRGQQSLITFDMPGKEKPTDSPLTDSAPDEQPSLPDDAFKNALKQRFKKD